MQILSIVGSFVRSSIAKAAASRACRVAVAAVAFSGLNAVHSEAAIVDINVAGWKTFGEFTLTPGTNTIFTTNLGAGATITGAEWIGLEFESLGTSYNSEVVLSLNRSNGASFWDVTVSDNDNPGVFGPSSGTFSSDAVLTGGGSFSLLGDGVLAVTVYELFDDANDDFSDQDAQFNAGTLRITYTAVPEPTSMALLATAGAGGFLIRRRRVLAKK